MTTLPTIIDEKDASSPLKNRIRNNYLKVQKWALCTSTNCFRIYDPERVPLTIDYYDGRYCLHYFSRIRGEEDLDPSFEKEITDALRSLFDISEDSIYWRTRMKREKRQQYEKLPEQCWTGRPPKSRYGIFNAFIAKAFLNMPTTLHLVERLQSDRLLRTCSKSF